MEKLIVFYDDACDLCRRCRLWAEAQPAHLVIEFRPLRLPATRETFPDLDRYEPENDLVVFTEEGAVHRGTNAWLMILWALKNWREWSFRLARPGWRPFVGRFWTWISTHRFKMLAGTMGDKDVLSQTLRKLPEPNRGSACPNPNQRTESKP